MSLYTLKTSFVIPAQAKASIRPVWITTSGNPFVQGHLLDLHCCFEVAIFHQTSKHVGEMLGSIDTLGGLHHEGQELLQVIIVL